MIAIVQAFVKGIYTTTKTAVLAVVAYLENLF